MIFHVPVIFHVEAKTMEEARELAYGVVEAVNADPYPSFLPVNDAGMSSVELVMADDTYTDPKTNRRIVILHPNDTDAWYDEHEYKAKLLAAKKDEDDE